MYGVNTYLPAVSNGLSEIIDWLNFGFVVALLGQEGVRNAAKSGTDLDDPSYVSETPARVAYSLNKFF